MRVEIFEHADPITSRIIATFGQGYFSARELEMFDHAQNLGPVYCALVDDCFVACWGVIPPTFLSEQAYLWFWGPPVRFPVAVLRYSKRVIREILNRYPSLYGHCHCGSNAMRWMQWLGGEFGSPQNGLIPFEIRRG